MKQLEESMNNTEPLNSYVRKDYLGLPCVLHSTKSAGSSAHVGRRTSYMGAALRTLVIFLVLLAGAAAAPATAQAAGCTGTGSCFWVGGTGNWSDTTKWATTSGGATTGGLPAATDNATFDANSNTTAYTVTVDTAANMLNLSFSAAPSVSGTITWAGSSAMNIYGSMTLLSGMTRSYTGAITFSATATGKTITSNGVGLGSGGVTFDGVGGDWTLNDTFSMSGFPGALTVTNGTFNSGNQTITTNQFNSSSGTRTINLGSSTVNINGANTSLIFVASGLTFNAGTSNIIFNQGNVNGARLVGGGVTFYDVTFTSLHTTFSPGIDGTNTFHNLTLNQSGTPFSITFSLGASQTVTGTLSITGASASTHPLISSDTAGTARTITAAAVSLTDVDFTDITGAGAAAPFTGTRLGNAAGNSGITFTAAANKYYVGNTANWNGTVWALTSGGAAAANNFPLPQDTAIFDNNSFSANSQTVTVSANGTKLPTVDFSGMTNRSSITWTVNVLMTSYGDIKLTTATGFAISAGSGNMTFLGRNTQTITSNGVSSWDHTFTIDSLGGTVTLADNFTNGSGKTFTLTNGTLNLNGQTLSTGFFSSSNSNIRAITSGGGTMTVTGNNGTIWGSNTATNFTLNDALQVNATYSGSTGTRTITHGGSAGATETNSPSFAITAGTDTISGPTTKTKNFDFTGFSGTWNRASSANLYGNLTLSPTMSFTNSATLIFAATSGTKTITSNGKTLDFPVTFDGVGGTWQLADALTLGSTRTLTLTNGTLDLNGKALSTGLFSSTNSNTRAVTDSIGGASFTLTGNSNTIWTTATPAGLTVTNMPTVTANYSGGSGTRTVTGSGGAPATAVSFNITAGTDIVTVSGEVRDLNFTGFTGTMGLQTRSIYGNLNMGTVTAVGAGANPTTFAATSGTQTITTNGKTLDFPVTFDGAGGTFQLADAMTVGSTRTTTLTNGTLDINGKTLSTGIFDSTNANVRTITSTAPGGKIATTWITAGTTVFNTANATNLTVTRNSWTIEIGGNTANTGRNFACGTTGGGRTWPALTFTNTIVGGELQFVGSNTFKSISVSSPPQTLKFTAGTTNTIEDANGFPSGTSAANLVTIGSITAASHTLTYSGTGHIFAKYLSISRSTATPASTWFASNSLDGGNNSGWSFSNSDALVPTLTPTNPNRFQLKGGTFRSNGGSLQIR